jgi:hypothetical protein
MKWGFRVSAAAVLLSACSAVAMHGDALIVAAGGVAGKWDTELQIANPSVQPMHVSLFIKVPFLGMPCPPNCASTDRTIPGNGTVRVLASDFIGSIFPGPQMIHVEPDAGAPLPIVHARVINRDSGSQFGELPVTRESSVEALGSSPLVFPGASRSGGVYSNLVLESLGAGATDGTALVEVFDSSGARVGSLSVPVPAEGGFFALTLPDVVHLAGADALSAGQVRVTRQSGQGALWGALATVDTSGSLIVSVGANP